MTGNQVWQVLRTYTTRWLFWLAAVMWLGWHLAVPYSDRDTLSRGIIVPLMGMEVMAVLVGMMVKIQFTNPRARLLPGFAAAHLLVAGAILVTAVFVGAGAFAISGSISCLTMAGCYFVVVAAGAWHAYSMSQVGTYLLIAFIALTPFAPQYAAALLQSLDERPVVPLALAGLGLAALAALGWRLWALSEEMPEYSRQMPTPRWDLAGRAGDRDRRRWEAQVIARSPTRGWLLDGLCRLVFRRLPAAGPLRRMLLRQLAGGFSGLIWAQFLFGLVIFVLAIQRWPERPVSAGATLGFTVFLISFFPFQMALSLPGGQWLRRWPHFARESLLPVGRTVFVRDLALAMAMDVAAAAVGHCAGVVAWFVLFRPQSPLVGLLPLWIAITLVQYVAAYCLLFWLISFRSLWVLMLGILPAAPILAGLVVGALYAGEQLWTAAIVVPAFLLTAVGAALLYRLAYRRWCRVELD